MPFGMLFLHVRTKVLSHMGNIWIGPWAIFPQYVDSTLNVCYLTLFTIKDFGLLLQGCPSVAQ